MILFLNIIILFLNFFIGRVFGYFLGWRGVSTVFFFNLLCVFLNLLFYLYYQLISLTPIIYETNLGVWVKVGEMEVEWLFLFDRLAICMALMIIIISGLVHFYSIVYMKNEPQLIKFLSYLSLFTAFMFILVNSGNFLVLFLGWEGVGLCSYLLISFWTTRIPAGKAALKALLMNRIGDFFLLIAICFFFKYFKTINFEELFILYSYYDKIKLNIFGNTVFLKEFLAFLLIFAAVGKSAQIGLHTWLPDAMEGPTPVSALIHAATMVTAGIYLLIRCSFFFIATPIALNFIIICGLLTCVISALIALTQYDLKKIIAYSTCSQLGYMFYSCGVLNFSASLFHLFNHAFFKALLFLAAGAIIHALNGEQDIRKMGNLHQILPFYYLCFIIATLSLSGFIFFSGYYSKDLIINTCLVQENFLPKAVHQELGVRFILWSYWLLIFGVACTAAYSSRLIYYVFFRPHISLTMSYNAVRKIHTVVPVEYKIIFSILVVFSIFSGWYLKNLFVYSLFFNNSFYINLNNNYIEFIPIYILNLPVLFSIFSALFIFVQYNGKNIEAESGTFIIFLNRKLYIDSIYNFVVCLPVIRFSFNVFRYIDKGVVEYFGPLGVTQVVFRISEFLDSLHNRQFLWTWYLSISCAMLMVIIVHNLW